MSSECRAKNPATCRKHGTGVASTSEEAKKEFYGEEWNKVVSADEQAKVSSTVSTGLQSAFRDIQGFSSKNTEGIRTNEELVALLANPELKTEGENGDSSTAVTNVRQLLRDSYDSTENGGPSALATVRLFKSLKRANELGDDIRGQALEQAQKPAVGASFAAKMEGIVSLLHKHRLLGEVTGKELDREQRSFAMRIEKRAKGKYSKQPESIMYRASDTEVAVFAKAVNDEIVINKIRIIDYSPDRHTTDTQTLAKEFEHIFNMKVIAPEKRIIPKQQ